MAGASSAGAAREMTVLSKAQCDQSKFQYWISDLYHEDGDETLLSRG